MNKKILIVVAHPDDEILGIAGTAIRHIANKDDAYVLILGTGVLSRGSGTGGDVKRLREDACDVGRVVGFKEVFFSDFPDNNFDSVSLLEIIKKIEEYFNKIKPDIVYTHFENDLNVDHRLTFQAVMTASRPCSNFYPKQIFSFETLSSTEWQSKSTGQFLPNYYVNIKDVISKKIEAMKRYKTEIRQYPHPRSEEGIKILAKYRGLESGLEYAEALCMVRNIKK